MEFKIKLKSAYYNIDLEKVSIKIYFDRAQQERVNKAVHNNKIPGGIF